MTGLPRFDDIERAWFQSKRGDEEAFYRFKADLYQHQTAPGDKRALSDFLYRLCDLVGDDFLRDKDIRDLVHADLFCVMSLEYTPADHPDRSRRMEMMRALRSMRVQVTDAQYQQAFGQKQHIVPVDL